MADDKKKDATAGSPVASFQTRRDKPIEVMSLQEKFIELRRQIPRIEKEQHSEEVPYKFAKIDDVWRAITPTMNELGVNFDIVKEENASIKTMNMQHGGAMFLYESDLTIQWTNADNEDDTDTAQTHAIAWNDDPAKAKGSAWTYAIKYYLFEKFSIDMGETDPDMRGAPKQAARNASQTLETPHRRLKRAQAINSKARARNRPRTARKRPRNAPQARSSTGYTGKLRTRASQKNRQTAGSIICITKRRRLSPCQSMKIFASAWTRRPKN